MDDLKAAALSYLHDDKFADFTIVCSEKEYKVHRCFISAHSRWFDRCCAGSFAEAKDRRVELKDDLPEAVDRMITYFYTFDYDDAPSVDIDENSWAQERPTFATQVNAHVYALADKYQMSGLQELALLKFKSSATKALGKKMEMVGAAHTIYKHISLPEEDKTLKNLVIDMWIMSGDSLASTTNDGIGRMLCKVIPEFFVDLAARFLSGMAQDQMFVRCSNCNKRGGPKRAFWKEDGNDGKTIDCSGCKEKRAIAQDVQVLGSVKMTTFW